MAYFYSKAESYRLAEESVVDLKKETDLDKQSGWSGNKRGRNEIPAKETVNKL